MLPFTALHPFLQGQAGTDLAQKAREIMLAEVRIPIRSKAPPALDQFIEEGESQQTFLDRPPPRWSRSRTR